MPRFLARGLLGAVMALPVVSFAAGAQIMRRPEAPRRINYIGANVGFIQGYSLADGTTNANWRFGSGLEYAARLEHPTQSGIAVGVQASYAKMPVSYSSPACSCDATAAVTQVMGLLHYGSGYAFHGVYELTAGMVGYSDFRRSDDPSVQLGTGNIDYDFKFALGYGLGFGLSPTTSIEIIQEYGTILHQRQGLSAGESNYPRVAVTRLGGKISF